MCMVGCLSVQKNIYNNSGSFPTLTIDCFRQDTQNSCFLCNKCNINSNHSGLLILSIFSSGLGR